MSDVLLNLYGVGPALAAKLWAALGSPARLTEAMARRRLREPKLHAMLPRATQIDLQYGPFPRVPHAVIAEIEKLYRAAAGRTPIVFAGSYRRGKVDSGDIDIVFVGQVARWQAIAAALNQDGPLHVLPPFASGPARVATLFCYETRGTAWAAQFGAKLYIKVDTFFTTRAALPFALLYATGSGEFNQQMRSRAKRHGYLLNQYGLFRRGLPIADTEEDVFRILEIEWKEPADR